MGLGDWIMATSQAKRVNEATGRQVLFVNHSGKIQRSDVFENNPRIATHPGPNLQLVKNCPGTRPYIAGKSDHAWRWQTWDISPGEIWLSDEEKRKAEWTAGMVMIEPHTKVPGGNKSWPFDRWQKLVSDMPEVEFIQPHRLGARILSGVTAAETTFREAAAMLSHCRAFVGTEGALHHAAAALNVPAVVLWSEFISPEFTGYETQLNIRHANGACGSRLPCAGCKASMERISVNEVKQELRCLICIIS